MSTATSFSLFSLGLAATFSFAMASLVYWQSPTNRNNIIIGGYLLTGGFSLLFNLLIRLGYFFPFVSYLQDLVFLQLYVLPSLPFLLFTGIVLYTDYFQKKTQNLVLGTSFLFLLFFFIINTVSPVLLLSNFDNLSYTASGELILEATPFLIVLQVGTLIWGITGLVLAWRTQKNWYLFFALLFIFMVGFLDAVPFLRNWNINSLFGLAGKILLTFTILNDHLFDPLKQLNLELLRSQEDLRHAYDEVEMLVEQRTYELEQALEREQGLSTKLEGALQKQEELNTLKSHIIETVSHEFRTPLTVIQSAVDLIHRYEDRLSAEKKGVQFDRIRSQIFYLSDLLRDTVFVNHFRDHALKPKWESTTFEQIHSAIVEVIDREDLLVPLIDVDVNVQDETREIVTDLDLVQQVTLNLLINAFKYGEGTKIALEICENETGWFIQIKDGGIGFPKNEADRLFELFYRGSNVETRRGLGLGLNIAQEIVTALGGRISAYSEGVHLGSCFTIHLPLLPVSPAVLSNPS